MNFQLTSLPFLYKTIICIVLVFSYFIISLKTKSIEKEEIQLYLFMEKKLGNRFKFIGKIIRKFIK